MLELTLVIMGMGVIVGLVSPKQVMSWIIKVGIVTPLLLVVGVSLFKDLYAHAGIVPFMALFFAIIFFLIFKFVFNRAVMSQVAALSLHEFIVRPLLSSPFAWKFALILLSGAFLLLIASLWAGWQ